MGKAVLRTESLGLCRINTILFNTHWTDYSMYCESISIIYENFIYTYIYIFVSFKTNQIIQIFPQVWTLIFQLASSDSNCGVLNWNQHQVSSNAIFKKCIWNFSQQQNIVGGWRHLVKLPRLIRKSFFQHEIRIAKIQA